MTTNKPMTGEQLDELMTVAVNMQRDSEKVGDSYRAIFAFAVQVAVLELRKVREAKPADEDHVAAMNSIKAIIAIIGSSDTLGISEQVAELKAQRDALAAELSQHNKGISDLEFERACPDYMVCDLCGHDAHHSGGGNYECSEGHLFSVSEKLFGSRVVPTGWVAVPADPTGDMLARIRLSDDWTTEALTARYKDMLHAAPRAPYVAFSAQLRKGVQS